METPSIAATYENPGSDVPALGAGTVTVSGAYGSFPYHSNEQCNNWSGNHSNGDDDVDGNVDGNGSEEASFADIPESESEFFFLGSAALGCPNDLSFSWTGLPVFAGHETHRNEEGKGDIGQNEHEHDAADVATCSVADESSADRSRGNGKQHLIANSDPGRSCGSHESRSKPQKNRRRGAPKRSSGLPKRPLSAYNLYFQAERAKMLKRCKEANIRMERNSEPCTVSMPSFQEFGRMIGRQWRELARSEKLMYERLAEKDGDRYHYELQAYHHKKRILRERLLEQEDTKEGVAESSSSSSFFCVATTDAYSMLPRLESQPGSILPCTPSNDLIKNKSAGIDEAGPATTPMSPLHPVTPPPLSPVTPICREGSGTGGAVTSPGSAEVVANCFAIPGASDGITDGIGDRTVNPIARTELAPFGRVVGSLGNATCRDVEKRLGDSQLREHNTNNTNTYQPSFARTSYPAMGGPAGIPYNGSPYPTSGSFAVVTPSQERMSVHIPNSGSTSLPSSLQAPSVTTAETILPFTHPTTVPPGNRSSVQHPNQKEKTTDTPSEYSIPMPSGMIVVLPNPYTGVSQRHQLHYTCFTMGRKEADSFLEQFKARTGNPIGIVSTNEG